MSSTYFDDQWLQMPESRVTTAKCRVSPIPRNKIELSNMRKQALKSHASGKKHCERLALYSQTSRISFTPFQNLSLLHQSRHQIILVK